MKLVASAAAFSLVVGVALAQTSPSSRSPAADPGASNSTVPDAATADRNKGEAGVSGNRNQAAATTSDNAPHPAKGANSFSAGEARRRIEKNGYSTVTDLKKDSDGIWRGRGSKNGASAAIWLDYKGNIGQQ